MGLTRRHSAVTLLSQDKQYNCPGGGTMHPLKVDAGGGGEWHGWMECKTCLKWVFLLQLKYGLAIVWEIEWHEVQTMQRERMGVQQILEYLNRGAKRLDRT